MNTAVLDFTGTAINVGDLVAVQTSTSSVGATKIGTVIKINERKKEFYTSRDTVRVDYKEEKGYVPFDDLHTLFKYNNLRTEKMEAGKSVRFEVKHSYATVDAMNVIVLHRVMIEENGKKFYISKYEAELR